MSNEREFFKYIPSDMVEEIKESERRSKKRSEYIFSFIERFSESLNDSFIEKINNKDLDSRSKIKEKLKRDSLLAEVSLLFLKKKKKQEDTDINEILESSDLFLEYFLSCVHEPFREKIYEFEKEEKKNGQKNRDESKK